MDKEGFSGRDGRSTIFDWWSISSVQRLRKVIESGAYTSLDAETLTSAGLSRDEAEIFVQFANASRLASSDEAISSGTTYDLSYCNFSSEGFNKVKHFAFLRDYEDHTLLIVTNFSSVDAKMNIVIPEHAFEWMQISISDELFPGKSIIVDVPAYGGKIIELI
jgi:hypothetical protein